MASKMKKKLHPPKTKRLRRKPKSHAPIILAIASLLLAGGIIYTKTIFRPASIQIAEITNSNGSINLTLSAAQSALKPNEETLVTLTYNAPTHKLNVVHAEISYDSSLITVSNVTPGDQFPTQLRAATTTGDKIVFAYGVAIPVEPDFLPTSVTGTGTLATFKIKANQVGTATLAITSNTKALTKEAGSATNDLREITNAVITIADPVVISPSPSPSSSGNTTNTSPSPIASVSPSPTTSPSVAPSTPASPERPAKPTGLRSNCFDNGNKITLRWDGVAGVSTYKLRMDQKDGSDDKSIDNISKTEQEVTVIPDKKYSWWVHSTKNGVDSDEAKINEVVCAKPAGSSPTPTPAATPTPTPKPTNQPLTQKITNLFKKSPTPAPTISPTPTPAMTPSTPTPTPGSLSDIYKGPIPSPDASSTPEPGIISKIFIGWKEFFARLFGGTTK